MELTFSLARGSRFRYTCNRCRKCCHDKRIMLNPYEVMRLARNQGISTGEFIERFTVEGGTVLKFEGPDNACVFLGPEGCTVHPDRPLACRLYPLGRFATPAGLEAFTVHPGHPESLGVFTPESELGESDTVGAFLDSQNVADHVRAAERYYALFSRLQEIEISAGAQPADSGPELDDLENLLDADFVIARYCEARGLTPPETVEAKMEMHIRALTEWADSLAAHSSQ